MPNIIPTDKRELSKRDSSRQDSWFTLYQMVEKRHKAKKTPPLKAQEVVTIEDAKRVIIDLQRQNQELRRTQLELESARKEYTDFYEIAPVGYITISERGLILKANLTAATLLGIDRSELLKQPFYRFIRSEDQDSFYLMRKNLLQTGESHSLDLQLIGQDGTSFWTNLQTVAKLSESGKTVIRVVLSDISKRKLAEESLLKIFHQNKTILESITDAFIALSDDMVVFYFNAPAEEIFGLKQSEVIGRKIFDVFSEGKGTVFEENCLQVIRTKAPVFFETEFNVAPYQNWLGIQVYPSSEGITIYLKVITERKKIEEGKAKLKKTESLERMAGAIAHLFNNHLQVALGNLEMALNSLPSDAVQRDYLINAKQANQRSSEVSGLLLTYLGQKTGKLEPLDLSQICRRALSGSEIASPGIISIEADLQLPGPLIHANSSQVQQIITILIANAYEAMRGQTGRVTVVTKTLPASVIPTSHVAHIERTTVSEKFACLEVTDTGCGMSDEEMEKIFDPFYSTKFTGRGLGLPVAMSLVKAWSGTIHAYSIAGKGSCFRVFLPLAADVTDLQPDLSTEQKTQKATGTVLFVDDDPLIHQVIKNIIEHLSFSVLVATSGAEAVSVLKRQPNSIDCLLTDLSMQGMNGWETLAALRQIRPDLPAILSSGYDEAHVMSGDHKELPQVFLHKPYTKDDLENALNRVLGNAAGDGPLKGRTTNST